MFTFYGLCFFICKSYRWFDVKDYLTLGFALFLLELCFAALCFLISANKKTKVCIESTQPIKPKIVHVQDSSRKIIQYRHKELDHEKIIMKDDIKFFIPESLIYVQPCTGEISAKKEGE